MNFSNSCIAIYPPSSEEREALQRVLKELLSLDYPIEKLSVIGKGSLIEERSIGIVRTNNRLQYKGEQEDFWHSLWDLISGEAFFMMPGLGSLATAGGVTTLLLDEDTSGFDYQDFTELGRALHQVGVPKTSVKYYEELIKEGQVILVIQGNYQDIEKAGELVEQSKKDVEVSLHFSSTA